MVNADAELLRNNNLTRSEIVKIFKAANEQDNSNNICLKEALLIMLQIVHSFKHALDNSKDWFEKNKVDSIPVYLPHLLLSVLHEINGSSARLRDLDPEWEEEYERILGLPNSSFELDARITQFLLLPLYESTHPNLDYQ